ncbi:hypothetical protein GCM10009809_18060 [Isoptericola hypogeus]|uniref:Acid-resistance membrane protein n=1 Tax=Isoptericola hypogeus TaxID=300179 RepID=A0ABN2JCP7_9MICO
MSDDTSAVPLSQRTIGTARRLWGLVYLRAVAYLAGGVVLFLNPDEGLVWLRWLIGLVILVQGILLIVEGRPTKGEPSAESAGDEVSWRFVVGIVSVAAALVVVMWPSMSAQVLYLVVGIWACAAGVSGIIGGLRGRALRALAWDWQLANAVLWLVLGVLIFARPTDDTVTIALLLALYLVLAGAVILVGGFASTTRVRDERKGRAAPVAGAAPSGRPETPPSGRADTPPSSRAETPPSSPPDGPVHTDPAGEPGTGPAGTGAAGPRHDDETRHG